MPQHVIQNCIDWNIKMRDTNRHNAMVAQQAPHLVQEHTRNARRHQRNIDELNRQLG